MSVLSDASSVSPRARKRVKPSRFRSNHFQIVRTAMGRSQSEIATTLGISTKAVQSYEQGWRRVSPRIMSQFLVLLALHRGRAKTLQACWRVRHCPVKIRNHCPAYLIAHGRFCWFIAGKKCTPSHKRNATYTATCMECRVIKQLLKTGRSKKS